MRSDPAIELSPDGLEAVPAGPVPGPGRHLVIVPRDPGPVAPLRIGPEGPPDDLDLFVDEVLGPTTDEKPGLFDIVLAIGGTVVLAWALVTGAAAWVAIVAGAAIVLGLALPARSLVRRVRSARVAGRIRSAGRRGYVLDVGDPATADLVAAHGAIVDGAALPGAVYGARALDGSHAALVEVATLLDGDAIRTDAQRAYVEKRATAVREVADLLGEAHQRSVDTRRAGEEAAAARQGRWLDAVTVARDELQAEDRQGSLAKLGRVSRRLRREAEDGREP